MHHEMDDNNAYIITGISIDYIPIKSCLIFNIANQEFRHLGTIITYRMMCGTLQVDGYLLIFGGDFKKNIETVERIKLNSNEDFQEI